MMNNEITKEWIAQQRAVCAKANEQIFSMEKARAEAAIVFELFAAAIDALEAAIAENEQLKAKWETQTHANLSADQRSIVDRLRYGLVHRLSVVLGADEVHIAMNAIEREAEKDAEISRLEIELSRPESYYLLNKIIDLTAERDAEKKRADAVTEINLRPLQPGYMGVCTTDDEDGIQIRKVSHKHPQSRGYLDDDEDVQDVVVIRFADTAQVLAVVDRLLVLADAMAEKTRTTSANTDAPTGAGSDPIKDVNMKGISIHNYGDVKSQKIISIKTMDDNIDL